MVNDHADKLYLAIAILGILGLLLVSILTGITIRRRAREELTHCRYRSKKRLMEGPEKRCFQLLVDLFGEKFYVIPDVAISALLSHHVGAQNRQAAKSLIENRTVDFVLCNKRTIRPICAVKLAESHPKSPRSPIDVSPSDLKKFFKSAHLPLVYIPHPDKISRTYLIDAFSQEVYESSRPSRKK